MMRLMKKCKYCGLTLVWGLNMFFGLFEFSNSRLINRNRNIFTHLTYTYISSVNVEEI